jgi:hypothetical protein
MSLINSLFFVETLGQKTKITGLIKFSEHIIIVKKIIIIKPREILAKFQALEIYLMSMSNLTLY